MKFIIEFDKEEEFDKIIDIFSDRITSDVVEAIRKEKRNEPHLSYNMVSGPCRYKFDNITFDNHKDAKDVLDGIRECIDQYNLVRVFDLYDLAGVHSDPMDKTYGWEGWELKNVSVKCVGNYSEWMIDLPEPHRFARITKGGLE